MEREIATINDLPVGTIAKGSAWSEGESPGYNKRIDGAKIVNMGNGEKGAHLDKGKTGRPEILGGKTRIINIKMRET